MQLTEKPLQQSPIHGVSGSSGEASMVGNISINQKKVNVYPFQLTENRAGYRLMDRPILCGVCGGNTGSSTWSAEKGCCEKEITIACEIGDSSVASRRNRND
jgi:hypothetical protein